MDLSRYRDSIIVTNRTGMVARVAIQSAAVGDYARQHGLSSLDAPVMLAAAYLGLTKVEAESILDERSSYQVREGSASTFNSTQHWGAVPVHIVQIKSSLIPAVRTPAIQEVARPDVRSEPPRKPPADEQEEMSPEEIAGKKAEKREEDIRTIAVACAVLVPFLWLVMYFPLKWLLSFITGVSELGIPGIILGIVYLFVIVPALYLWDKMLRSFKRMEVNFLRPLLVFCVLPFLLIMVAMFYAEFQSKKREYYEVRREATDAVGKMQAAYAEIDAQFKEAENLISQGRALDAVTAYQEILKRPAMQRRFSRDFADEMRFCKKSKLFSMDAAMRDLLLEYDKLVERRVMDDIRQKARDAILECVKRTDLWLEKARGKLIVKVMAEPTCDVLARLKKQATAAGKADVPQDVSLLLERFDDRKVFLKVLDDAYESFAHLHGWIPITDGDTRYSLEMEVLQSKPTPATVRYQNALLYTYTRVDVSVAVRLMDRGRKLVEKMVKAEGLPVEWSIDNLNDHNVIIWEEFKSDDIVLDRGLRNRAAGFATQHVLDILLRAPLDKLLDLAQHNPRSACILYLMSGGDKKYSE